MKRQTTKNEAGKTASKRIRIFTDGAGPRPDGKGSGFAWIREDTKQKQIQHVDGLTNNMAEYMAVQSALESLPNGIAVEILTDSEVVVNQFNGTFRVKSHLLIPLLARVQETVAQKKLQVIVSWIPRDLNLAGKLL